MGATSDFDFPSLTVTLVDEFKGIWSKFAQNPGYWFFSVPSGIEASGETERRSRKTLSPGRLGIPVSLLHQIDEPGADYATIPPATEDIICIYFLVMFCICFFLFVFDSSVGRQVAACVYTTVHQAQ